MSSHDFLLELGSEEIPAGYIASAREQIVDIASKWFVNNELEAKDIKGFSTPRRLTLHVSSVSDKQALSEKVIIGPPAKVAFNPDGTLSKAGTGFTRNQDCAIEDTFKIQTDKGEYLAVKKMVGGLNTYDLLPDLCEEILTKINFPKSMYWEATQYRYARPLRWIVALFGDQVITYSKAGVDSSNITYGHKIRANEQIVLQTANLLEYLSVLEKAFVIADHNKRKDSIRQLLNKSETRNYDENLLDIVTNLVECPAIIQGSFSPEYLKLPQDVLITSMKHHQKYFPLINDNGNLDSGFISIHNSDKNAERFIKEGNERVLEARLSDAHFFWKEDTKNKLEDKFPKLSGLLFQAKLGNYDKKTKRIEQLSQFVGELVGLTSIETGHVQKAAHLSKIDLITEMVKEFTELQGVMGKHYANFDGEDSEVALAIEEHYLPKGPESPLPSNLIGSIVSIADKLDSIIGCFGIGMIPTGSEDPFALRRSANGIIRIIANHPEWNLSLEKIIDKAIELYVSDGIDASSGHDAVFDFFLNRLKAFMAEKEYSYDTIDATLSVDFKNVSDALLRCDALHSIRHSDDFNPLTVAFKRTMNILKQAREKYNAQTFGQPNESYFIDSSEINLFKTINVITGEINRFCSEKNYMMALQEIAKLRTPIDLFFEKVMVMDKDDTIRNNRLALLEMMENSFNKIADFSCLVIEE